jgi:hypothetical protein
MGRIRTFALLVRPSLTSGIFCLAITTGIIVTTAWSYISANALFYDFLFGRFGVTAALLATQGDVRLTLPQNILSSSTTYYLITLICAILAGFLVYELLQGVGKASRATQLLINEATGQNQRAKTALRQSLARLAVRLASLICWFVYSALFITLAIPFVVALVQVGISAIDRSMFDGWLYIGAATLLLFISLHLHVIFARLSTLRLRIYGAAKLSQD